jgi:hypothetical protein
MQNLDKVKAFAKMTALAPRDYHALVFQLEAYMLASKYIFGESSILTRQLHQFVKKTKKHSLKYKRCIAGEENFAAKILLAVNKQVSLFLNKCCSCDNSKNVNKQFINFDKLHISINLYCFNINLPPNFLKKAVVEPTGKENNPNSSRKKGGGKRKGDGGQDNGGNGGCKHKNKLINNNQVLKFKIKDGKIWEKTFQG